MSALPLLFNRWTLGAIASLFLAWGIHHEWRVRIAAPLIAEGRAQRDKEVQSITKRAEDAEALLATQREAFKKIEAASKETDKALAQAVKDNAARKVAADKRIKELMNYQPKGDTECERVIDLINHETR
jgi:hypothetical protein